MAEGAILVQVVPEIEWRDGLVHITGAETGIRFAMSRHNFLVLLAAANEVAERMEAERSSVVWMQLQRCVAVRGGPV